MITTASRAAESGGKSPATLRSNVASLPPCRIAKSRRTASVNCWCPIIRARISSRTPAKPSSSAQKRCPPWAVIRARTFITSPNSTGTFTTAGCIDNRTKPNCVSGQLAHADEKLPANHRCAAAWCTWVGQAKANRTLTSSKDTTTTTARVPGTPERTLGPLGWPPPPPRLVRIEVLPASPGTQENRSVHPRASGPLSLAVLVLKARVPPPRPAPPPKPALRQVHHPPRPVSSAS